MLGAIRARIAESLAAEERGIPLKVDEAIDRLVRDWQEPVEVLPPGRQLAGESK
jgi:hypothetical protein